MMLLSNLENEEMRHDTQLKIVMPLGMATFVAIFVLWIWNIARGLQYDFNKLEQHPFLFSFISVCFLLFQLYPSKYQIRVRPQHITIYALLDPDCSLSTCLKFNHLQTKIISYENCKISVRTAKKLRLFPRQSNKKSAVTFF